MKNIQKGFVTSILLVFLGLLLIGSGAYVYMQKGQVNLSSSQPVTATQITDTSTWKFYTNPQYGFSFKYPNTMQLADSGVMADKYGQVEILNLEAASPAGTVAPISLVVRSKDQIDIFESKTMLGNIKSTSKIEIGSLDVTVYDSVININFSGKTTSHPEKFMIFQMGNYSYELSSNDSGYSVYLPTILSTFASN